MYFFENQETIAKLDLGAIVKQLLLEKYKLVGETYDPSDPLSVALFSEYYLDLYLLNIA